MGLMHGGYNLLLLRSLTPTVAMLNIKKKYNGVQRIENSKLYQPHYLKNYEKSQWYSPLELKKLQEKKLRALLKHAYEYVPYYHRVFKERGLKPDDIRNVDDLSKLPVLTKEIIKNNFSDMVAKNARGNDLVEMATGGSTGVPLKFYSNSLVDTLNWAAVFRAMIWQGVTRIDKTLHIQGVIPPTEQWSKKDFYISAFDLAEDTLEKHAKNVLEFQPDFITGYSSAIYVVARFMEKKGYDKVTPKAVESQSEVLYPYQREQIERVFGCKVFDHYGCKETAISACECQEHAGLHISVENGIFEFVQNGEQASSGERGEILMTDFINYSMPFIRYKVGDIGNLIDDECACGRGLPLMMPVEGRANDIILTPAGIYLPGPSLTILFGNLDVKQYQVIQKTKAKFLINLVKGDEYTSKDTEWLIKSFREKVGDNIEIEINFKSSIPLTKYGKQRIIISEVSQ